MFEDILGKRKMNISQLSVNSNIGYNYIYKIVRNQTSFDHCGIETAKRIADAFEMSLDELYEYKNSYFQHKIYYQDQSDWDCEMFGELNAELNKLFLIGIEYHFSSHTISRKKESCLRYDDEIRCISYDRLTEETKCIMVAILNQQKILDKFIKKYPNLSSLSTQPPLSHMLSIASTPYNLFQAYLDMNIEY